jgi:EF hand
MWRTLFALAFAAAIGSADSAWAQRAQENDEVKKLEAEINRLQDTIKKIEAQMKKAQEAKTPDPKGRADDRKMPPSTGFGGGRGKGPAPAGPGAGPPGGPGGAPPGGRPGVGGPGGGGGPGAGGSQPKDPDAGIEARFRQLDLNEDGMLSADELSEDLRRERELWDTNHDGFIDLNEFKAYVRARMARNQEQRGGSSGGSSSATGGSSGGFGGSSSGGFFGIGFGGPGAAPAIRVKLLEAELNQLKQNAKTIADRTKEVEARLKEEKVQEEAALRAARSKSAAESGSAPSPDIEKRLDRIEQALEEIQRELRRKR